MIANKATYETYLTGFFCQKLNFSFSLSEIGGKITKPRIIELKPAPTELSAKAAKLESKINTPKTYLNVFIS